MNNLSRTQNSKKNIINGIVNQFVLLVLTFFSRTIFIKILGEEFLGINGLYSNILQLLSLSELGISNIALFTLYKPINDNDKQKISSLINFYKKLYRIIFVVVLVIGLALIPVLPHIVDSNLKMSDLILFYIISVFNIALSYTFVYYRLLLMADQRINIVKNITTILTVIQNGVQILVLLLTKDYALYLVIQCIFTLLINIIVSIKAKKTYGFVEQKIELGQEERKQIFKSTKNLFVYKLCVVIVNSSDNIIISVLLGTVFVGYYSNYYLIISCILNFMNIFINSIMSSIGNFNVSKDAEEKHKFFVHLVFAFQWISSVISICLICLFNEFISLWLGSNYVLSEFLVIVLTFNFYIQSVINPVWIYRETLGLYSKVKYIMLMTATLNIILSIIFGKLFGLEGICLATGISRVFTTVIFEPIILYKEIFDEKVRTYYFLQIKYFIVFVILTIFLNFLFKCFVASNIVLWILKAILVFVISNLAYLIIFNRNNSFKYFLQKVRYNSK